jgi:hypothetical protein
VRSRPRSSSTPATPPPPPFAGSSKRRGVPLPGRRSTTAASRTRVDMPVSRGRPPFTRARTDHGWGWLEESV